MPIVILSCHTFTTPDLEVKFTSFVKLFSIDCKVKALDVLITFSLKMEDSEVDSIVRISKTFLMPLHIIDFSYKVFTNLSDYLGEKHV